MANSDLAFFQSHIVPVYRRALVWDQNARIFIQTCFRQIHSFRMEMDHFHSFIDGSCVDGGATARMYDSPSVIEFDYLNLIMVSSGLNHGKPHPEKVGAYLSGQLRQENSNSEDVPLEFLNNINMCLPDLSSSRIALEAMEKGLKYLANHPQFIPIGFIKELKFVFANGIMKGPSFKSKFTVHKDKLYLLMDRVHGFHHYGWPEEAEEWKTRKRRWPPDPVVEHIIQFGYHVIFRFTDSKGEAEGPLETQITFTLPERLLAKKRTPFQQLVYLMAKTLFYSYLDLKDDIDPNIEFPSYALKTCMMWLMEQTPVESWVLQNVRYLLQKLLQLLLSGVQDGMLKHYFMIRANVLQNCTQSLLEKVNVKLKYILSNTNSCLQATNLYDGNVLLYGYQMLSGGEKAYNRLVYYYQTRLFRELIGLIKKISQVKALYQNIIEILEEGTGKGLKAKGYQFTEEECYCVLKAMLGVYCIGRANALITSSKFRLSVAKNLGRYMYDTDDVIERIFCLDQNIKDTPYLIARLFIHWEGNKPRIRPIYTCGSQIPKGMLQAALQYLEPEIQQKAIDGEMAKETDLVMVNTWEIGYIDNEMVYKGPNVHMYAWSALEYNVDCLANKMEMVSAKPIEKILYLTHNDIPEVQQMELARALYLLYMCEDKKAPE